MVAQLVEECTEIDIDDEHVDRVEVVWKVKAGSSMGGVTLGTCKPVGKREREAWRGTGPCPFWRVTLALDVWVLMTPSERWRLLHHELMHAAYKDSGDPSGRKHDIEEFAATVARYGLVGEEQATFVAQAMARPAIVEEMREWSIDPTTGQGMLFSSDLAPVGW